MTSAVAVVPRGAAREPRAAASWAPVGAGLLTVLVGAASVILGLAGVFHRFAGLRVGWLLPLVGAQFRPDALGGLFAVVIGAVAVPVGFYLMGYARRAHLPRTSLWVVPLFVVAMTAVALAGSITTFLFAWELMALASLVLVLSEHRRDEARTAAIHYAVLTQLGFAAVLVGLVVLSASANADAFTGLTAHVRSVPHGTRAVVFVTTLIGFGSKAGLAPLHAWLPRAHAEAPTPVSALMSAAMVSLGIYGMIRFDLQILGSGPRWWGLTLLIVGALSAMYGVLQASAASDLKRLLAYSTTENMGLITLALGASTLLQAAGAHSAAGIATVAALLHILAHAAFKVLAFMCAGSVLAGTGLRDLDRLGGLARPMPITSTLFGVAALGACGLPLGAGFVSEWLLVQALIHAPRTADTSIRLAMPLAVGAVALTTGLATAAMVKAFGIGFLARPRSREAAGAREASGSMVTGMALAGSACLVLSFAPMVIGPMLRRVADALPTTRGRTPRLGLLLRLPGVGGSISPTWLVVALIAAALAAGLLMAWGMWRRPQPVTVPLWACGADELSSRMQYTATSFAEPLQRVFDDVLRPDTDVEVTHLAESRYLVEKITFRSRTADAIERQLYEPVIRAVRAASELARRAHPGSVHIYLAYGALGLLVVLVASR